jgi:hypothetical protein
MNNNFFHKIGHKLPTNHYVEHTLVTIGLFLLLLATYLTFGIFISFALGASMFYWSRELAQWEIRGGKFELMDALYPTVAVFGLAIILTILF